MYDILTIGTAARDVYLRSSSFKTVHDPEHLKNVSSLSGEATCFPFGAKLEIEKPVFAVGGGAANAAVTFARCNLKVAAMCKLGRDSAGREVENYLREEKVNLHALYDDRLATSFSCVLLNGQGERTILNYRGAADNMKKAELPLDMLQAHFVYIVPGHLSLPILEADVLGARANGAKIAINPSMFLIQNYAKRLEKILALASVVVLNHEEAAALTVLPYGNILPILSSLREKAPKAVVAVTDGREGSYVLHGENTWKAGIYRERAVIDRTGAGDAYGAAMVAALVGAHFDALDDKAIENAIAYATANATSVVESIGASTGVISAAQFARELRFRRFEIAKI